MSDIYIKWAVSYLMNHFRAADILLPKSCEYDKWAVIACDQHTSEPEYWENVRKYINGSPSTLEMFFPEAELSKVSTAVFEQCSKQMETYLKEDFFQVFPSSYIYVERTLAGGDIRQGIVGMIDLAHYDYAPKEDTRIFATEATVLQRVPPRISLRKIADLEFAHTVMFCDDANYSIVEPIARMRDQLVKLYDFDLMYDGGHISGYLIDKEKSAELESAIAQYETEHPYLVGDGNHALVTAKLTYQSLKEDHAEWDWENHSARFAMVELENIHSSAMVFEPIYRIARCGCPKEMVEAFQKLDSDEGVPVNWILGEKEGCVKLALQEGELPIEALQRFLDRWMETDNGSIDYIHGTDTVRKLAQEAGTVGFLVPEFDKGILFPYILSGKVMPKKTFSIGRAEEKRYYLEGRRIR